MSKSSACYFYDAVVIPYCHANEFLDMEARVKAWNDIHKSDSMQITLTAHNSFNTTGMTDAHRTIASAPMSLRLESGRIGSYQTDEKIMKTVVGFSVMPDRPLRKFIKENLVPHEEIRPYLYQSVAVSETYGVKPEDIPSVMENQVKVFTDDPHIFHDNSTGIEFSVDGEYDCTVEDLVLAPTKKLTRNIIKTNVIYPGREAKNENT